MSSIETIAVTGASGHLGTAIVLNALDRGLKVKAGYSSYKPDIEHKNLSWIKGDLSIEPLKALIADTQAVVHVAAIISVTGDKDELVKRTNIDGTRNVIDIVKAQGNCRLLFISSATVAEEYPHTEPFDETRPLKGDDAFMYEYTKVQCENMLNEEDDLDYVILRPTGIFGPPDLRNSTIGTVLTDLYLGQLPLLTSGGYDLVDVRDLSNGIVNALNQGRSGEAYLLCGEYFPLKKVAKILHKLGGAKPPKVIPLSFVFRLLPLIQAFGKSSDTMTKQGLMILRDGHPKMSSEKAQNEIGFTPRPLKESLSDMIDWWREAGIVD